MERRIYLDPACSSMNKQHDISSWICSELIGLTLLHSFYFCLSILRDPVAVSGGGLNGRCLTFRLSGFHWASLHAVSYRPDAISFAYKLSGMWPFNHDELFFSIIRSGNSPLKTH